MSLLDADIDALKRIVRNYNTDMEHLRFVDMTYSSPQGRGAYAGFRSARAISKANCIALRWTMEADD